MVRRLELGIEALQQVVYLKDPNRFANLWRELLEFVVANFDFENLELYIDADNMAPLTVLHLFPRSLDWTPP